MSSIKKNYIYNLLYQIIIIITPIITAPYLARVLGAERVGIYSYTYSIVTYFVIAAVLGTTTYGTREIAYCSKSKKKYSNTFWEIFSFRLITTCISFLAYLLFCAISNNYQQYFLILSIEVFATLFDITWFFQGREEFKKIVIRNIIIRLLSITSIFLFVHSPDDLIFYFLITTTATLIGNISLWFVLPGQIERPNRKSLRVFSHTKGILQVFAPQIATQIYNVLDRTMIGVIYSNKSEVGYYEQAQKIVHILLTIVTAMGGVMIPRIASLHADKNQEQITHYLSKSFKLVFILAYPIIFGLITVSDLFVPIFFGEGYESVKILIPLLSPIILFIGITNVIGTQYLLATRRQREFTMSVIVGAVVNLIMNAIFIPIMGSFGAAIGTLFAEFSVVIAQAIFVRTEFNLIKIICASWRAFIAATIMFAICLLIHLLPLTPITSILLQVSAGAIAYLLILIILRDDMISNIFNKIGAKTHAK